ncbi:MAG: hypothetical protein AB7O95_20985 [Geminicoccaceae bacterium]
MLKETAVTTRRLIPVLALILSGCATGMWTHPTKDQERFNVDRYECIKDGEQYAANLGFNGNPLIVNDRARECMVVKGYVWVKTASTPVAK